VNICEYCDKEIKEAYLPIHVECAARWLEAQPNAVAVKNFVAETEKKYKKKMLAERLTI
jgi:hypothetical protein